MDLQIVPVPNNENIFKCDLNKVNTQFMSGQDSGFKLKEKQIWNFNIPGTRG